MEPQDIRADVVVPVHGGLHHVRHCLRSLAEHSVGARVVVVDDASPPHDARALDRLVAELAGPVPFELVRNERNLGYLRTTNRGFRAGTAPYVVALNSDVVVTEGWLDGLVAALEADTRNTIASPLSNHANLTRIDFPWGADHRAMARFVRERSPASYPEIGIASGFCLIVRRDRLEQLDYLDEAYDPGYFEESDLCMRAMARGWRVVADDATFVFHHGWASFGPEQRTALMERNAAVFAARWGEATHRAWQQRVRDEQPFAELEAAAREELGSGHAGTGAGPRWTIERARQRPTPATSLPSLGRVSPGVVGAAEPAGRRPGATVVLLPHVADDTPTAGVLRLCSELVLRGVAVHVATPGRVTAAAFSDPVVLRPGVYEGVDDLVSRLPAHDLVVATSLDTLLPALALQERDDCHVAAMLGDGVGVPVEAPLDRLADVGRDVVPRVAHLFVRAGDVPPRPDGPVRHPVPLGVDLDVFHPRPDPPARPHVVVPSSAGASAAEWRTLVDALALLAERRPEVRVSCHGDRRVPTPPGARLHGRLTLGDEAALLRDATVVVDPSATAPSRRARLRALAAGVPLVVVRGSFGDDDVVLPGHTCTAVEPADPDALAAAALEVVADPTSHAAIVAGGRAAVERRDLGREIASAATAIDRILERAPRVAPADVAHERDGLATAIAAAGSRAAREATSVRAELAEARRRLDDVYASETWRVGRAVTALPRGLRRLLRERAP